MLRSVLITAVLFSLFASNGCKESAGGGVVPKAQNPPKEGPTPIKLGDPSAKEKPAPKIGPKAE